MSRLLFAAGHANCVRDNSLGHHWDSSGELREGNSWALTRSSSCWAQTRTGITRNSGKALCRTYRSDNSIIRSFERPIANAFLLVWAAPHCAKIKIFLFCSIYSWRWAEGLQSMAYWRCLCKRWRFNDTVNKCSFTTTSWWLKNCKMDAIFLGWNRNSSVLTHSSSSWGRARTDIIWNSGQALYRTYRSDNSINVHLNKPSSPCSW